MSGVDDGLRAIEEHLKEEFASDPSSGEWSDDEPDERDGVLAGVVCDLVEDLFCVACGKSFRSANALESHERSKKHKENVSLLRQQLVDENIDGQAASYGDVPNSSYLETGDVRSRKPKKKKRRTKDPGEVSKESEEVTASLDGLLIDTNDTIDSHHNDKTVPCPDVPKDSTLSARCDRVASKSDEHICNTCGTVFSTRNKLFQHLKDTNHVLRVEGPLAAGQSGKKKKKSGRKLK